MHSTNLRITLCTGCLLVAGVALALALVGGCGGNPVKPGDTGPGVTTPTGPWTFAPDASSGAAVTLKVESIQENRAALQVVVTGVPKLQGIAFRLGFDPARLKLGKTEQGAAWTTGTWFPTAVRFAPRPNGELWAGLGYVGSHELDATKEMVVARVEVELTGNDPIPIGFRPLRNLVIDPANNPVQVTWVGGTFKRAPK